jgi:hypothetical protein
MIDMRRARILPDGLDVLHPAAADRVEASVLSYATGGHRLSDASAPSATLSRAAATRGQRQAAP